MATSTANGDPTAAIDELKAPSGIVLPPREIRNVLEKTAGYVARNGPVFEQRIREKELNNPKFSFLAPDDAYHAFYQWRLDEVKAGRGTAVATGRAADGSAPVPTKPAGPPKPPEFEFSARMPRINQGDLEVLRLTAMFVARNGRQWMTKLAQREVGNAQFQFLNTTHTFHNFFQRLVDQYTFLIRSNGVGGEGTRMKEQTMAELEHNVEDRFHVLARAKQRAEYARYEAEERQKKEEEEAKKRQEFESIDWGDFVVVETITFTPSDATANLPPPTTLQDLQYASLEERNKVSINPNLRIEEAMPTDEPEPSPASFPLPVHTAYVPQHAPPGPQAPQQPQYPTSPAPSHPAPPTHQMSAQQEEEERRIQERTEARDRAHQARAGALGGPPIKIRENYVPRAAQRGAKQSTTTVCPNCKQMVPVNEIDEHMRIELLDPRWKEQKAKGEARYMSTDLSQVDVAHNLKRLASQRRDLFDGVTGEALSEEERERRKRAATAAGTASGPVFEGNTGPTPAQLQRMTVEEQIKAIHDKFGGGGGSGGSGPGGPGGSGGKPS